MEIGQDSHTNDDSLKRSLDILVQELGELQERNKQLNKELEEVIE